MIQGVDTEATMMDLEEEEEEASVRMDHGRSSSIREWHAVDQVHDIMSFGSDESFDLGSDDDDRSRSSAKDNVPADSSPGRFDIELLRRCIEGGQPTLNKIDGKDVCLVIGKTGTGKSTLIQGFAGKRFRAVDHVTVVDGKTLTKTVYEPEDPLEGFEIGHDKISKTRTLNCFEYQSPELEPKCTFFVDSPGFEDTGGHEIDTATSVLLRQVAQRCKSLRFIIVISFTSLLDSRGQPMRGILKMIKSFVDDFQQEQKSFMFLFSHALQQFDKDVNSAYERLRKEIEDLLHGSTDEDVKVVLQFLKKSLKNRYPYVQIFSPTTSDFANIVRFAEKRLKPIHGAMATGNCGLAMSSQFKLQGEVPRALLEVKTLLERTLHIDTKRVLEIYSTLGSLHEFIGSTDIKKGLDECKRYIDGHCDKQRKIVDRALAHGTEFGPQFGAENIVELKNACQCLSDLAAMNEKSMVDRIVLRVSKFRHSTLEALPQGRWQDVCDGLEKLRAWATGFPDACQTCYDEVRSGVQNKLKSIGDRVRVVMDLDLGSAEKLELTDLSEVLSILLSCQRHLSLLVNHDIDLAGVSSLEESLCSCLVQTISSWKDTVSSSMRPSRYTLEELRQFASRARVLQLLQSNDGQELALGRLGPVASSAYCDIKEVVLEYYQDSLVEWTSPTITLTEETFVNIKALLDGAKYFVDFSAEWQSVQMSSNSILANVRNILSERAKKLDSLSKAAKNSGVKHADAARAKIVEFKRCVVFDNLFDPWDQFVQNVFIAVCHNYAGRMDEIKKQVDARFDELQDEKFDSITALESMFEVATEIQEISILAPLVGMDSFIGFEKDVNSRLNHYLAKMQRRRDTCTSKWEKALKDPSARSTLRSETIKLDDLLCQAAVVPTLTTDKTVHAQGEMLANSIKQSIQRFTRTVELELSEPSDFKLLAHYLSVMHDFKDLGFLGPLVPACENLTTKALAMVSRKAQKIENLVETSAEWDKIDALIAELERGIAIDEFVDGQVSSRLGPLRKLRQKKETDVESEVEILIGQNDFQGIGSLIAPFAESSDQLKRQRFHRFETEIFASLNKIMALVTTSLETRLNDATVKEVAESMHTLRTAEKEIGRYFSRKIRADIKNVRQTVNKKFDTFFSNFHQAKLSSDLTRMAMAKSRAKMFVTFLGDEAPPDARQKVVGMQATYDELLSSISREISLFFDEGFSNGTEVIKLMSSLERCGTHDHPAMEELTAAYTRHSQTLQDTLHAALGDIHTSVTEREWFDDGVVILQRVVHALDAGLSKHIDIARLPYDCKEVLKAWRLAAENVDGFLVVEGSSMQEAIKNLGKKLEGLKAEWPMTRMVRSWMANSDRTYDKLRLHVREKIGRMESLAAACLRTADTSGLQTYIENLGLLVSHVHTHVPYAAKALDSIQKATRIRFQEIVSDAIKTLNANDFASFENLFPGIRFYVLDIPLISEDQKLMEDFRLVNQLIYQSLAMKVESLRSMLEMKSDKVDFLAVRAAVQHTRTVGGFVADYCTLFFAEMAAAKHLVEDPWLAKVMALCKEHFADGRNFKNLTQCAILGVVPSADVKEIKRAFRAKAKVHHPDKAADSGDDVNSNFRRIKEAEEVLVDVASSRDVHRKRTFDQEIRQSRVHIVHRKRAFDQEIRQIRVHIVHKAKAYLHEQRYDAIDNILSSLPGLREIKDLIEPQFDDASTREAVHDVIVEHVKKTKTEVNTLWSERKYRDLNDTIEDLKAMEESLKCHSAVFPASWNEGILEEIEGETKKLAGECRRYLASQALAKEHENEFRRSFLQLGCILVELPSMKSSTKAIMVDVLEKCLHEEWGFGYLFELGLSLQRGEDTTDDTDHVAHLILAEFSHFKEVLTMAWNTETVQKPVDDTVKHMMAESLGTPAESLEMNESVLLDNFSVFEAEYNTLLGTFIRPESDKSELVRHVIKICEKIRPTCCVARWDQDIRDAIPKILGGVFALFSICKSGESFNRIQASNASSKLGKQVLLKPHNIQILTLLYMFGCNERSGTSLESQLLQIRTGEGKSMILGAAATVLGLLGFRVRCVCYSEYLSMRDHDAFLQIFKEFGLDDAIVYCQITKLSEEMVNRKGDIRSLTTNLLLQRLGSGSKSSPDIRKEDQSMITRVDSNKQSNDRSFAKGEIEYGGTGLTVRAGGDYAEENDHEDPFIISSSKALMRTRTFSSPRTEEILLVDEVDVFFGSGFYGQSYNQVTQIREPEVRQILELIWTSYKQGGSRLHLSEIKKTEAYASLVVKLLPFADIVDSEISLMLDAVRRVDDEPYFVDSRGRIGYKVLDTVSYDVTMGYRTVFAYLKENDRGKLSDPQKALNNALCMNVSCGQFSYANVSPSRILGVSGTLSAMGVYEKSVLQKYGVSRFVFLPSVYGQSNFHFDKAGDGVCIETNQSDFYHRINTEIKNAISANRAAIVFFAGGSELVDFQNSAHFRQLGRKRAVLSEDLDAQTKDFIVKKASTAGQVTICSAVFGRGTDFFCKDQKVEDNGGVHVIQTFLSAERSEEVQIQGRTARQGKKGTYQLVLLESDLQDKFGIAPGFKDGYPKKEWYKQLCCVRDNAYAAHCSEMESNLAEATTRDKNTHQYFDALLAHDESRAGHLFKGIYSSMKKGVMPSSFAIDLCFVLDVTGSMSRYMKATNETIASLLVGGNSIVTRLRRTFPDIEFKLRIGAMSFRDFDDGSAQFHENIFSDGGRFSENASDALHGISLLTNNPCGGDDLAEDIFGAVHQCSNWTGWSSAIKFMILVTDAPAHGFVPSGAGYSGNADKFPQIHPNGHTAESTADVLIQKGIDLAFCSFCPTATEPTEEGLAKHYKEHASNTHMREIVRLPMVAKENDPTAPILGDRNQHIIFVLDDSGSMAHNWAGVEAAYGGFCSSRLESQCSSDIVSVVQFSGTAIVSFSLQNISSAPRRLGYRGGGTYYTPAAQEASTLVSVTPASHEPVVIFMSDGMADEQDSVNTARIFSVMNAEVQQRWRTHLELHVIAFGSGLDTRQLANIMRSSARGRIHSSANVSQLSDIFIEIAKTSSDVAGALESEIGRRISDAVSDKIALEYLG